MPGPVAPARIDSAEDVVARDAVARLLEEHGPRIFSLALRLCGNRADAEDMVQDVFLQAYRKWHTFRGEADPGTWLYSIAARSCNARMRRKGGTDRRMPAVSQLMPWRETSIAAIPMPSEDGEAAPVKASIRREAEEAVHRAILTLPEPFRVPLILKEMLELPIEQVGAALNIKPETVKTRVHRARLLLRQAMLRRVPQRSAPDPMYDKRVCLDLLKAKLDAMDRGRGFPIGQDVLCERCRAVFAELDLAQSACASMAEGSMPASVRRAILNAIRRERINS
ncbi:MAG: RNA polymerase sigma factor [Phycisphaeraceae bacterium]|nr:RNA polymerase sigma factor [Phycisphaeraceae bacterium]